MMENNTGNLVLFSSEHVYEINGKFYITQSKLDTFSLQCAPFKNVTLAVPKDLNVLNKDLLVELPSKYDVLPIYEIKGSGIQKRIKGVFKTIFTFLKHHKLWDVVYIRLFFWDALFAGILSVLFKKRLFVSLHGDIEEAIHINWKNRNYPKWFKYLIAKNLKNVTSWISYKGEVLFVSGPALAQKYTPRRDDTIPFLDSGYSSNDIFIREDTCQKKPATILYVGELVERKGIKYLLESIKLIKEKENNVILNIVGTGDLEKYQKMTVDLNITENVNFLGYKSFGNPLFNEFKKADIFVLPSIGTEGWSRVLIEANAHSLPIVTTEVGSLGHAARECNCGLIANTGDSKSLAENIIKIIKDDQLRQSLIKGSIKRAHKYTKENERRKVWESLHQVFPKLVNNYEKQ